MRSLPPLMQRRLAPGGPGEHQRLDPAAIPAWLRRTEAESRLFVMVAIIVAIALQVTLPSTFGAQPRIALVVLQVLLLIGLTVINPLRMSRATRIGRVASLSLVALITGDNAASAVLLDYHLISGTSGVSALVLLGSAASIYITNVIAFAIWYWEFDRGGPFDRAAARNPYPDFLFPQMMNPEIARPSWQPTFGDYLYVSFTNATAFSPTDTLPLSGWAKALMAAQSAIALTTTALVVARAVNILA